jgi:hypothetical protein
MEKADSNKQVDTSSCGSRVNPVMQEVHKNRYKGKTVRMELAFECIPLRHFMWLTSITSHMFESSPSSPRTG